MNSCLKMLSIASALASFSIMGCGEEENTVIEPTVIYELTEQEQANRDRADKLLMEQRQ